MAYVLVFHVRVVLLGNVVYVFDKLSEQGTLTEGEMQSANPDASYLMAVAECCQSLSSQERRTFGVCVVDVLVFIFAKASFTGQMEDFTPNSCSRRLDSHISHENSKWISENIEGVDDIFEEIRRLTGDEYSELKETVSCRKFVQESEAGAGKSNAQLMKENNGPFTVGNRISIPAADSQRESQKSLPSTVGSYSAGRLVKVADSRTIFVSNVHFAATKDSLSRHFNKFGDVLKVSIVTNATGQPKGPAYVEFMKREAAEHALSLEGTSFMSRILKVVKKNAVARSCNCDDMASNF